MGKCFRILSAVLIASFILFYGCSSKENADIPENKASDTVSEKSDLSDKDENSAESGMTDTEHETAHAAETTPPEENSRDAEPVTVSADDEKNVHESGDSLPDEANFNRPASLKGTEVFIGWEEEDILSGISDNADETIVLNAESENISDIENAVFNDTVYAEKTAEYVDIPVIIGGKVNFSVLDLGIAFDTDIFSFDSFRFTDSDAECNCTDDGKILVSFVSTVNITADVNLCSIRLKKISTECTETRLHYDVMDIAAWNETFTDYVNVPYSIVNDKIVVY